jgi:hypothetical protein
LYYVKSQGEEKEQHPENSEKSDSLQNVSATFETGYLPNISRKAPARIGILRTTGGIWTAERASAASARGVTSRARQWNLTRRGQEEGRRGEQRIAMLAGNRRACRDAKVSG